MWFDSETGSFGRPFTADLHPQAFREGAGRGGFRRRMSFGFDPRQRNFGYHPSPAVRDGFMERAAITEAILRIFEERFEISDPGLDDHLGDAYEFDSIDAVELLHEIELLLGTQLTRNEKKSAMEIRTIAQIVDYIEALSVARGNDPAPSPERRQSPVER